MLSGWCPRWSAAESAQAFTAAVHERRRAALMNALFVWLPAINLSPWRQELEKFWRAFNFEPRKCKRRRSAKSGCAMSENVNYYRDLRALDLVRESVRLHLRVCEREREGGGWKRQIVVCVRVCKCERGALRACLWRDVTLESALPELLDICLRDVAKQPHSEFFSCWRLRLFCGRI